MKYIISVLVLVAIGFGVYKYVNKTEVVAEVPKAKFDDSSMITTFTRLPDEQNSVKSFNALPAFAKVDTDFFATYLKAYNSKKLPPIVKSQALVTKYKKAVTTFDAAQTLQFKCYGRLNEQCSYQPVRNTVDLIATKSLLLYQQNKLMDAKKNAQNIVSFGKNLVANADEDILALIIGFDTQQLGYDLLETISTKDKKLALTAEEKDIARNELRNAQKDTSKYLYTLAAQSIDYLTSANNKPTDIVMNPDEEEVIAEYRKAINSTSWKPEETKKYFFDLYQSSIKNVDLVCGSAYPKSIVEFDLSNPQTENFVGKTLYSTVAATFDSLNIKRCNIENAINNL